MAYVKLPDDANPNVPEQTAGSQIYINKYIMHKIYKTYIIYIYIYICVFGSRVVFGSRYQCAIGRPLVGTTDALQLWL